MKKVILVVSIFLILLLTGCGVVTPATDEAKVKSVIQDWSLAINAQNWNKALSYCVYGSDKYYYICQLRDAISSLNQYCSIVTINIVITNIQVSIYGSYANASCYVSAVISACGYIESESLYGNLTLQKMGNSWKLY
jgi:type II secretory pathway pseudopilin PulG